MHFHLNILLAFLSISHASKILKDDTIFTREQLSYLEGRGPRNAAKWNDYFWPKSTVVYSFSDDLTSATTKSKIKSAMHDISSHTCIKFRKTSNSKEPQVVIQDDKPGCWSSYGYWGLNGKMIINLGENCVFNNVIQHEILHTLGFAHQQNSIDRDQYVKIHFENIIKKNIPIFNIQETQDFGVGYDYGSIMHYGPYFFSKNKKETITPLQEGAIKVIGTAERISPKDILKLNGAYCH